MTSARASRPCCGRRSRAPSSTTASGRTSRRSCSRCVARRAARQIFVEPDPQGLPASRLFELEVPEIHSGTVEIKAIAREAGSRSKVAVASRQEGLDPVGATVGQRGARVQAVVAELSRREDRRHPLERRRRRVRGQRAEPGPGASRVDIDEEHRIASVTVPERMLSLAIGREGQNARLAARLTGWRIDIRSDVSVAEARAAADAAPAVADEAPEAAVVADADAAEAPAKPKRVTKKAAVAAEAADDAVPAEAVAEAPDVPAKPKRATKKAAAAPDEAPEAVATDAEAPAKPKRVTKKAAVAARGDGRRPGRGGRRGARHPGQAQAGHQEGSRRGRGGVVAAAHASAPRRVPTRSCVVCRTA